MTKVIMHGCNGKMGQMITGLIAADDEIEIVAGVDAFETGNNTYPVFKSIGLCDIGADVVIDFSNAQAIDGLLDYCMEKKLPCVLCTTGLSEAQLQKVEEAGEKTAVLKSANMSLGINLLLKLLKDAAGILAPAGFDIEIVEKIVFVKLYKIIKQFKKMVQSIKIVMEAMCTAFLMNNKQQKHC